MIGGVRVEQRGRFQHSAIMYIRSCHHVAAVSCRVVGGGGCGIVCVVVIGAVASVVAGTKIISFCHDHGQHSNRWIVMPLYVSLSTPLPTTTTAPRPRRQRGRTISGIDFLS